MGGNCGACHIVCRVLHRGKRINLLPHRENHNPPGVLPCSAPHPHASLDNAVHLTVSLVDAPLLIIFFYVAESRFIRQSTDSPCPESLSVAENHLCVGVGLALVFPGKIKVNIRLLVPFESQKSLKRNVKPLLA